MNVMKKKVFFLRLFIGIFILLFLIYKLDISNIYKTLTSVTPLIILLAVLHYGSSIIINALGIKVLLTSLNKKIKFLSFLKDYVTSYSIGQFSPGKLGEFSLPYLLNKKGVDYGTGFSSLVVYKLTVFITLAIISIIGFFLFFSVLVGIRFSIIIICLLFVACFSLVSKLVRGVIKKYILKTHSSKFKGFYNNIKYLLKNKKRFIFLSFLIIILRLIVSTFLIYIMFLFFGINVPFIIIPVIVAMALITTLIPISISGLGVKEATAVFLYSRIGVDALISGSLYILLTFIYYLLGGFFTLILTKNLFKKKLF